jgi:hypothetical protein
MAEGGPVTTGEWNDTHGARPASGPAARGGRPADGRRREFLKKMVVAPAALAAAQYAVNASAGPAEEPKLPQIRLGKHTVSRLICGSNPFNGGSHLSVFVNHAMREYFTPEQILKTLRRCQEVGINCWQAGTGNCDLYRRFLNEGGKMHFVAIASGDPSSVKALADAGCIAIAHHGETTDQLFKSGRLDEMQDYLRRVRDAGLVVGVSTHMPDVVDAVESKGWDVDYYMTCVYERHRNAEALKTLLGQAPIPVGEVYLPLDPPRMFKAVRQTRKPCLAFKILAAGRLSERPAWVEQAFRETLASIKPSDGIIVGIYDRHSDQPAENAALVRRFGASPAGT